MLLDEFSARHVLSTQVEKVEGCNREATTALLVRALLHADTVVRRTAASLAFNMSLYADDDDDWKIECVSAIASAFEHESDQETLHRLASALCHLLYRASEAVLDLARVLDLPRFIQLKQESVDKTHVKQLLSELASLL
jgi:hypothetical protein